MDAVFKREMTRLTEFTQQLRLANQDPASQNIKRSEQILKSQTSLHALADEKTQKSSTEHRRRMISGSAEPADPDTANADALDPEEDQEGEVEDPAIEETKQQAVKDAIKSDLISLTEQQVRQAKNFIDAKHTSAQQFSVDGDPLYVTDYLGEEWINNVVSQTLLFV
jgi:hypothetical protein